MYTRIAEDSPLLEYPAGPRWNSKDDDRQALRRSLLTEPRNHSRRRSRSRLPATPAEPAVSSSCRRNWRVSPTGAAGAVMFAMALVGLVAIFSTIERERQPRSDSPRKHVDDAVFAASSPSAKPLSDAAQSSGGQRATVTIEVGEEEDEQERQEQEEQEGREEKVKVKVERATWPNEKQDQDQDRKDDVAKTKTKAKPNVFVIMVDDMGWNDIGYQSIDLKGVTPNMDKLAAGGVKMTNYYSMPICTPARASLMTGRYVSRYGLQYSVIQPGAPWGLPLTEKLFPQYMKDGGYETHMIGKWHIGSYESSFLPSQRGFDTFMGYLNDEEMYWTHQSWSAHLQGRKFFDFGFGNSTGYYDIIERPLPDHVRNGTEGDDDNTMLSPTSDSSSSGGFFKGVYSTQVFTDRALDILEQKTPFDEEPLYMYLAHQAVHDPLGLPPDGCFSEEEEALLDEIEAGSVDGSLRNRFAKVLMYLDHSIGELVDYLETEGWMENSIIVLTSDNGGCPSCGGNNYPLRGIKHSYWEGGLKVPSFIFSKSHIPEKRWGTEYNGLMHVTDWLPTIAKAAGIELTGGYGPLDGVDHWDYIVDVQKEEEAEFGSPRIELMHNFDPYILWTSSDDDSLGDPEYQLAQGAFRSGKYKYMANAWCSGWYSFDKHSLAEDHLTNQTLACDGSPCSNCAKGCSKHNYLDYLFDIEADPRETTNLIEVYPDIAHALRDRWVEIALSDFGNSSWAKIDKRSYYVWEKYNWWMVPWWDLALGATSDPYGINATSSSSSSSSTTYASWTSTVASSVE